MVVDHAQASVLFGAAGVAVLMLARAPLRRPRLPGSRGFLLAVVSISVWLLSTSLSSVVPGVRETAILYNLLLSGVLGCFLGYVLLAVEYSTQRLASRRVLALIAGIALAHALVLWTNFLGVHELVYGAGSTVEDGAFVPVRGPGFWVHTFAIQALILLSIALFAREVVAARGVRRRQSALLLGTPLPGLATNAFWLFADHGLTFDPTPLGVTIGVGMLGWALYRTHLLEVVPVARQTVFEEMPDAVVTIDDRGTVLDWNSPACELFGVEDPAVGMPAAAFFAPLEAQHRRELLEGAYGEQTFAFEHDGRPRHASAQVSPIGIGSDRPRGRVIVVRDTTQAVKRADRLVEQTDSLEEFVAITSHDVQGPLMELRGSANLAVRTGDVEQADHVLHAADRMEDVVDDMLRVASTGEQIDGTEPVSLATVAAAAWRGIWSVDAVLDVVDDAILVADPDRLQQLFENLLRNAVEHAGPAPTVTVGVLEDGFFVEDDGRGIPPERREAIFERGVSSSDDGAGLGLEIVSQVVDAHGWSIRVTDPVGGGSRFEVTGVTFAEGDDR